MSTKKNAKAETVAAPPAPAPSTGVPAEERNELRAALDKLGVPYKPSTNGATLRKLLAEATERERERLTQLAATEGASRAEILSARAKKAWATRRAMAAGAIAPQSAVPGSNGDGKADGVSDGKVPAVAAAGDGKADGKADGDGTATKPSRKRRAATPGVAKAANEAA